MGKHCDARPMPADFAGNARIMTQRELCQLYGAGTGVVRRWLTEARISRSKQRPMPADFFKNYHRMSWEDLQAHYACSAHTMGRWVKQLGLAKSVGRYCLPPNIAELCETHNLTSLARELGWDVTTVKRRLRVDRPDLYDMAQSNGVQQAGQQKKRISTPGHFAMKPMCARIEHHGVMSEADKAMRYLQRYGFGSCYPLRIYGKTLPGYRYMGRVWQDDELIAEAKRRGWKPDGWRELAA